MDEKFPPAERLAGGIFVWLPAFLHQVPLEDFVVNKEIERICIF